MVRLNRRFMVLLGDAIVWHTEGSKGTPSFVAHFQIHTDPLSEVGGP